MHPHTKGNASTLLHFCPKITCFSAEIRSFAGEIDTDPPQLATKAPKTRQFAPTVRHKNTLTKSPRLAIIKQFPQRGNPHRRRMSPSRQKNRGVRSWGRFRAPPVAEEARKKEWQQLGDWQVSCANAGRALVATGSARTTAQKNNKIQIGVWRSW